MSGSPATAKIYRCPSPKVLPSKENCYLSFTPNESQCSQTGISSRFIVLITQARCEVPINRKLLQIDTPCDLESHAIGCLLDLLGPSFRHLHTLLLLSSSSHNFLLLLLTSASHFLQTLRLLGVMHPSSPPSLLVVDPKAVRSF